MMHKCNTIQIRVDFLTIISQYCKGSKFECFWQLLCKSYRISVALSVKLKVWQLMQQHGGDLLMLHTCSINLCQRGRGSDFKKKTFSQKFSQKTTFFAIMYQEITTVCSFQPKVLGRNYL